MTVLDLEVALLGQMPLLSNNTKPTVFDRKCADSNSVPIWGKNPNYRSEWNIIQQVGYLYPSQEGIYTLKVGGVKAVRVWIGESAIWDFSQSNSYLSAWGTFEKTFKVESVDKYIPFRILTMSAQGCFNFYVDILDPRGALIVGRGKELSTDQIVTCSTKQEDNAPGLSF